MLAMRHRGSVKHATPGDDGTVTIAGASSAAGRSRDPGLSSTSGARSESGARSRSARTSALRVLPFLVTLMALVTAELRPLLETWSV